MFRMKNYWFPTAILILMGLLAVARAQHEPAADAQKKTEAKDQAATWAQKQDEDLDRERQKTLHQLATLKNQKEKLQGEQRAIREEIFQACDMSPENVVPSMLNMEREILSLKVEFAAKRANEQILAQTIAESSKNREQNIDSDEIVKNLKSIVGARQEALMVLKRGESQGSIPVQEITKAQSELSEAMIRLELRKEELLKGNGTAGMEKLNIRMRENSLELVQVEARLEILHSEYKRFRNIRDGVDAYIEIIDIRLPRINRQIDRLYDHINELGFIPEL
jgi:hypothetical protein